MSFAIWGLFVGAVLLMMSTPGPSHLLMLSTSATNGFKRSLATAAGDLTANMIQMALAGFGLAAILAASRYGFTVLKWAGVAYLIYIGVRTLRAASQHKTPAAQTAIAPLSQLWLRGFVTSAANPKAVVFFAALFPQFIDPAGNVLHQVLILSATYIVIDGAFLSLYGLSASWLVRRLKPHARAGIDRVAGLGIIAAAVLLGFKSMPKA